MINFPLPPEWLVYLIASEIFVIFALCIMSLIIEIIHKFKDVHSSSDDL